MGQQEKLCRYESLQATLDGWRADEEMLVRNLARATESQEASARISGGGPSDRIKHEGLVRKVGMPAFLAMYFVEVRKVQRARRSQVRTGLAHQAKHREWARYLYSRMRLKVKIFLDVRRRRAERAQQRRTNLEQERSPGEEDSIEASDPEEPDEAAQPSSKKLVEPTREKRAADPKKRADRRRAKKARKRARVKEAKKGEPLAIVASVPEELADFASEKSDPEEETLPAVGASAPLSTAEEDKIIGELSSRDQLFRAAFEALQVEQPEEGGVPGELQPNAFMVEVVPKMQFERAYHHHWSASVQMSKKNKQE